MAGYWTAAALLMGLVALIAAGVCLRAATRLERMVLLRQQALESRAGELERGAGMIEARLEEIHSLLTSGSVDVPKNAAAALVDEAPIEPLQEAMDPEIQAVIAAAAAAVAGPQACVRSVTMMRPQGDGSAWSQQGRVLVQTSHNLR